MKAAEEYYDRYDSLYNSSGLCHAEAFEQIMNEARKECLEECAERAKVIQFSPLMNALYNNSQSLVGSILAQNDCAVDKQSILSLINELK